MDSCICNANNFRTMLIIILILLYLLFIGVVAAFPSDNEGETAGKVAMTVLIGLLVVLTILIEISK